MNHQDHVTLIKNAITEKGGVWADLGSGTGSFTLALRDVAGDEVKIFSVDKNVDSLDQQRELMTEMFETTDITYLYQDFKENLSLPPLDGIVMANSLHYVQDQKAFLLSLHRYLKPEGKLVLVEYNAEKGNQWVPYPISFAKFQTLAASSEFSDPELLHIIPSQFLDEIYSAVTIVI